MRQLQQAQPGGGFEHLVQDRLGDPEVALQHGAERDAFLSQVASRDRARAGGLDGRLAESFEAVVAQEIVTAEPDQGLDLLGAQPVPDGDLVGPLQAVGRVVEVTGAAQATE